MTTCTLALEAECSLTAAFMVLLGSEGLKIPGLDETVGGQVKYAPIPIGLPELVLFECAERRGPAASANRRGDCRSNLDGT